MRQTNYGKKVCDRACKNLRLGGKSLCCCLAICKGSNCNQCDDSKHTLHQHCAKRNWKHVLFIFDLPHSLVFTLINLAVSAFALTSLDSVARVGRLSFQEFFMDSDTDEENMSPFVKVVTNKYFATIITLVLAYLLTKVGYAEIWPLFGSANQLLSVLALVACAVFLKKTKRQGWMLWVPMLFMMAVTFTALSMTIIKLTNAFMTTGLDLGNTLQLVFAVLLLILGVLVAIQGIKKLLEKADK